jgi:hypothetical protein
MSEPTCISCGAPADWSAVAYEDPADTPCEECEVHINLCDACARRGMLRVAGVDDVAAELGEDVVLL